MRSGASPSSKLPATAQATYLIRAADRVLVLGDVLANFSPPAGLGGLCEPPLLFSTDPAENRRSARRVADLEPALVCFGHGPPLEQHIAFRRLHRTTGRGLKWPSEGRSKRSCHRPPIGTRRHPLLDGGLASDNQPFMFDWPSRRTTLALTSASPDAANGSMIE